MQALERDWLSDSRNAFLYRLTPDVFRETQRDIRHHLDLLGIDFEGKPVPVSLIPTITSRAELERVAADAALIRNALLSTIDRFIREGSGNAPLHRFFAPYSAWAELIASERRSTPAINLMRYDCVREPSGRWSILENNTACPGGVVHCGRIRQAWRMTRLGRGFERQSRVVDYPVDSAFGFLGFLLVTADRAHGPDSGDLAICSYRGTYTNELATLRAQFQLMKDRGLVDPARELHVCDIRELRCDGAEARVGGRRVSLVYNKLDPLMIDPADPQLRGWLNAVRSPDVELLNSLGAMYLTETKRALAALSDPAFWPLLDLDLETTDAIRRLVPLTRVLADDRLEEFAAENQEQLALKADALTRGQGVFLGSEASPSEWRSAIRKTRRQGGVLQRLVDIPSRVNVRPDPRDPFALEGYLDYHGIDLFFFGDEFAGPVSRSHSGKVFNIGSGGMESPTLVVEGFQR